jgi:hypothetical protein
MWTVRSLLLLAYTKQMLPLCQVVFTDVLIVGRLDVDIQSFAPIGLHKTDTAFDWLLIKRQCICMKGLPGVQLQN